MTIFVYPRWPSAVMLDFIQPQIAAFDPPTPKTIAYRTKHGVDRMHRLRDIRLKVYCDLETGVLGHSRLSKVALIDRAHSVRKN